MKIKKLRKEIILNIGSSTAEYRESLARQIIADKISIKFLIDILLEEPPISTRFSWLLGDISIQSADRSKEILTECFKKLDQINIKNFDRTLSKQMLICGHDIPKSLEGEVVNNLFDWLLDPQKTVSTKNNCLFALENLCKKYPELKSEFIEVLKDQKELNSKDFKKRAEKTLERLARE